MRERMREAGWPREGFGRANLCRDKERGVAEQRWWERRFTPGFGGAVLEFSSLPLPARAGHSLGPLQDFGEEQKVLFWQRCSQWMSSDTA